MKTVVLYNIISFIIIVALIFVLRIVSKSNLRQNQQLVIKVIATILIVCVIAFVLFIDNSIWHYRTSSRLTIPICRTRSSRVWGRHAPTRSCPKGARIFKN